jgi:hypothetical protein
MAKGSEILLSSDPQGRFEECIVSGTPSPGTCMEIVPSIAPVGGRFTFRAVSRADGTKGPVVVLLPDRLQGYSATTAYTTGARGFMYWPIAGDELNMLERYQSGTGTAGIENIGDLLAIDGATGMLQAASGAASAPFQLREHQGVALTTNTLVWTQYLGNQA